MCGFLGQADIGQAASFTARRVGVRRTFAGFDQSADGGNGVERLLTQLRSEEHFLPSASGGVIDEAAIHGSTEHFFQTQRLRAELQRIVRPFPFVPFLVLDRVDLSAFFFDHIGLATDSQGVRVQIDTAELQGISACTDFAGVCAIVLKRAFDGVFVLDKDVLDENVITPPRAVVVLVQCREKNEIVHKNRL